MGAREVVRPGTRVTWLSEQGGLAGRWRCRAQVLTKHVHRAGVRGLLSSRDPDYRTVLVGVVFAAWNPEFQPRLDKLNTACRDASGIAVAQKTSKAD